MSAKPGREEGASASERELDVVVFGATGVTGRRVAQYLAGLGEAGPRWAAAARDTAKLERTLGELGVSAPQTIAADVEDPASLAAMARRAAVVLNLVGPYTLHGRAVIEACIEAGSHYADLTGEVPFMRRTIAECDERARAAGVKLVHACGLESLPPDLAVLLATEAARERHDEWLIEVEVEIGIRSTPGGLGIGDGVSGGTIQSMVEVAAGDDVESVTDPAALISDPDQATVVRALSPISVTPRRSRRAGAVVAPMAPAAYINPAVIHRTAELLGDETGSHPPPFAYREGFALGGGDATLPLRWGLAGALAGLQLTLGASTKLRPDIRKRLAGGLRGVLPKSGFGPTKGGLEDWRWGVSLWARTPGGHEIEVEVDIDGHPGYLSPARMIGETGALLAEPGLTPERHGCLTPAAALGTTSIERFERAGLRFSLAG